MLKHWKPSWQHYWNAVNPCQAINQILPLFHTLEGCGKQSVRDCISTCILSLPKCISPLQLLRLVIILLWFNFTSVRLATALWLGLWSVFLTITCTSLRVRECFIMRANSRSLLISTAAKEDTGKVHTYIQCVWYVRRPSCVKGHAVHVHEWCQLYTYTYSQSVSQSVSQSNF